MARLRQTDNTYNLEDDTVGQAVPRGSTAAAPPSTAQDTGQTHSPYEIGGVIGPHGPIQGPTTPGAYAGQLGGFDTAKMGKIDPKYVFGGYAQNYNVSDPSSYDKLLADLRNDPSGFFKNAYFDKDILHGAYDPETGQYGNVDVIKGYDAGGQGWQWGAMPESVGKVTPPTGGGMPFPPGGGTSGAPGGGIGMAPPGFNGDIMSVLKGLFPGGAFNQDVVNRRVSNASDALNRNRKSQMASTEALLASMGQGRNDGTFGTSAGNLETRLGEQFNSSVNDAYANEAQNADSRMIQALSMATGLTESQAQNAIDMARINSDNSLGWGNIGLGYRNADINERLGLGNLALGNSRSANDYNLGLGQLGLQRDNLLWQQSHAPIDDYMKLLELWMGAANQSANGNIGG